MDTRTCPHMTSNHVLMKAAVPRNSNPTFFSHLCQLWFYRELLQCTQLQKRTGAQHLNFICWHFTLEHNGSRGSRFLSFRYYGDGAQRAWARRLDSQMPIFIRDHVKRKHSSSDPRCSEELCQKTQACDPHTIYCYEVVCGWLNDGID